MEDNTEIIGLTLFGQSTIIPFRLSTDAQIVNKLSGKTTFIKFWMEVKFFHNSIVVM